MAWRGKITEISQMDSGGDVEVKFDVYKGSVLKYPNLIVHGLPSEIVDNIKIRVNDIKRETNRLLDISVGQEIEISEEQI
jgi:hypothetical protein